MRRTKIAPLLSALALDFTLLVSARRARAATAELRALIAVARAVIRYREDNGIVFFGGGAYLRSGRRLLDALSRLERLSVAASHPGEER
jgi:hypothetical protein